jgi:hypothetical protein
VIAWELSEEAFVRTLFQREFFLGKKRTEREIVLVFEPG